MGNGVAVIIVGAGGIGSALFQDLCRFLPLTMDIHLVDGDVVEGKNVQRQMFSKRHLRRNKAECLAETATIALEQARIYYHPQYLTEPGQLDQIAGNYKKGIVLVGAVDNHPARRVMEIFARGWVKRDGCLYYLDCANEKDRGEVVAVHVDDVTGITGDFRSEIDPAVLTDNTGDPTTASCTQQLDAGNIQTLFTNRKAAIIALELISYHLNGDTRYGIVYFSDVHTDRLKGVDVSGSPQVVPAS
ncbi:MAG TPA: ThiF family adenylyltransferase [Symbiobacteriaceae bacterium]|nr:ThiF family adenylyltransferase [Symbiobacteriaceae bacterium]